jgi:hypothetical protein
MWVDAARRWAARGLPSLRVDAEGIGDADGDAREYANVGAFYKPARGAQVVAALDALEERGLGHRFVLIGLCSGAYWAFRVALADDRIVGAVLLNPRALIWDTRLSTRRKARLARHVLRRESWRRFLRGEIRLRRIASVARAFGAHAVREALVAPARRLRSREQSDPETLEASFDRLHRRGTTVALAFSDDELLATELHESGLPERFSRWPNASFVQLPGRDHTVRPIVAQLAAHELIDRVLAQELDRSAERARGVPERVPR